MTNVISRLSRFHHASIIAWKFPTKKKRTWKWINNASNWNKRQDGFKPMIIFNGVSFVGVLSCLAAACDTFNKQKAFKNSPESLLQSIVQNISTKNMREFRAKLLLENLESLTFLYQRLSEVHRWAVSVNTWSLMIIDKQRSNLHKSGTYNFHWNLKINSFYITIISIDYCMLKNHISISRLKKWKENRVIVAEDRKMKFISNIYFELIIYQMELLGVRMYQFQ